LYADTVLQLAQLSPAGAAQLAADAEYFCNVMSALAVAPPAELVTVQLFAAVPAEQFEALASGAVAGGSADVKVCMRGGVNKGGGERGVMSALAVSPPAELVTVQLFAAVPAERFRGWRLAQELEAALISRCV
jgi:hypothetical protein